ncbi:MAG: EAL domain-containing protein [Sulfuricellaceae bacterium]|nr:EAL domain-containing protein [Sulfuricellaceae bacterium]
MDAQLYRQGENTLADFGALQLSSAFQPIFSLAHRRIVGYEGLLRAQTGKGLSLPPLTVFAEAESEAEKVHLDRLCRNLHLHNFTRFSNSDSWLFLNINPEVMVRGHHFGSFFAELLERHRMPPQRIVVEILEGQIYDEEALSEAVNFYRGLGCVIAIDDFGAGHSNFDRIWRIAPDIVKLDRSIIAQAATTARVKRVLPKLIQLLHESGSLTLIEGIENEEEAMIGINAGVDMVQGYYFGRPAAAASLTRHDAALMNRLCSRLDAYAQAERKQDDALLTPYRTAFLLACAQVQEGETTPRQASAALLRLPRTERIFMLDQQGRQIGENISSETARPQDQRFRPLLDVNGATWSRRSYFRNAVAQPGKLHVSRPYLSIIGSTSCVSLSMAFEIDGALHVLCCDLDWASA